ncbi:hypothetical protein CROQUDRAFT_132121 [Cronartium quercuum f. sp. fusiforme G11]|uniref:Mitochondrial import inner membrane translocase subunit TIM50 n=1 Tax=Cronartium quercuum f. sp. fusiforme G11 TaxID=708437 RepID=A0A9P6TD69_9BASI|nr:hypothetical protein CROQUDRAFT_132121 [Cronartium quercuum f. sp. fusiforme G11]
MILKEISIEVSDLEIRIPPPLLILDLNGSLLFRPKWKSESKRESPINRPNLRQFKDYIFGTHFINDLEYQNFEVMIWSSAQGKNVERMLTSLEISKRDLPLKFNKIKEEKVKNNDNNLNMRNDFDQINLIEKFNKSISLNDNHHHNNIKHEVIEIWDRSNMGLNELDYNAKVQTTKDLNKIWSSIVWRDPYQNTQRKKWDARNTIIIDDSPDKMSLQPYNLLEIKEYKGESEDDELLKVIEKLKILRKQSNISSFIKNGGLKGNIKIEDEEKVSTEQEKT